MEVTLCPEMSVLTRSAQRHIPEDGILHSYHREKLKSYKMYLFLWKKIDIYNKGVTMYRLLFQVAP
jgi:hypothetical protein